MKDKYGFSYVFERMNCKELFGFGAKVYLDLVKLFYVNMQKERPRI